MMTPTMFPNDDQEHDALRDDYIRRELNTLTEVSKTLITHADLPELLDAVMERIINTFTPAEFGV
ncbi:MAG: hypothetical protein WBB55_05920, partial [Anaerolineales bacterium]